MRSRRLVPDDALSPFVAGTGTGIGTRAATTTTRTTVTLIGTAHLSQKSNEQVARIIQAIQPNVVLVELDPSRLHRIGIQDISDIQVSRVIATSDDIVLPMVNMNKNNNNNNNKGLASIVGRLLFKPFWILQEALTEVFSRIARVLLTGMYKDMGKKMASAAAPAAPAGDDGDGNPPPDVVVVVGGGEFLAAIRAAEQVPACSTLILGDRSSVTTIKRAAMLALESGDPWGVWVRLQQANREEMQQLEAQVRAKLLLLARQEESTTTTTSSSSNNNTTTTTTTTTVDQDNAAVNVAMMEALKEDSQFRDRLFRKLEQQVPEFTQAFLKERDYIMAEAIRRELDNDDDESSSPDSNPEAVVVVERVVGVVGLAHVAGIAETLRAMFANETVPLLKTQNAEDEDRAS